MSLQVSTLAERQAVRAVLATSQNGKLFVSWHRLMR